MRGMNWTRLAQLARERREELGLHQQDVVDAAGTGLSLAVLSQLENGRNDNPRTSTLMALDRGLQWKAGSAKAILGGGDPVTLVDDIREARTRLLGAQVAARGGSKRAQRALSDAEASFRDAQRRIKDVGGEPIPAEPVVSISYDIPASDWEDLRERLNRLDALPERMAGLAQAVADLAQEVRSWRDEASRPARTGGGASTL